MSIFQNVDWVTSLTMVVCLAVIFAIVNVRLRLSLLRKEAKQLSEDVQRLKMWSEERRLSQLKAAQQNRQQTQVTA
jgi:glucan phosphoethanolaminetransferase (alkaline phosphatase superfamily)